MHRRRPRGAGVARWCAAAAAVALTGQIAAAPIGGAVAGADPGIAVFPGMEIHQGTARCTLGYVDVAARTAYTAGHCRGTGPVSDVGGALLGHQATFRDNTPDGATITGDQLISDWEAIDLVPEARPSDVLPGGRQLSVDPAVSAAPGAPVCHFGVVTGESCGTVDSVNNGWFTMANGVVSQKGDSGGPVYVLGGDGRAVLVGLFNSTWGALPAAVSWQATDAQHRQDQPAPRGRA